MEHLSKEQAKHVYETTFASVHSHIEEVQGMRIKANFLKCKACKIALTAALAALLPEVIALVHKGAQIAEKLLEIIGHVTGLNTDKIIDILKKVDSVGAAIDALCKAMDCC